MLLIDDDPDSRAAFAFVLQARGHRVLEADDGRAGLALACEHRPDVIVLDLSLPGLDGWETARRLRADPVTRGAWIVAMTGHTTGEAWQRARDAGVDGYLIKPATPEELIAEIERLAAPGPAGLTGPLHRQSRPLHRLARPAADGADWRDAAAPLTGLGPGRRASGRWSPSSAPPRCG